MTNNINLHHGDCLEVLRGMPDNSVDSIVTDPPYGLAFMGKRWDYDVPSVEIWAECLRVLKPGGHLLAFAGTRTQHRMAVRIEDAGFEIRDMIAWVYSTGFPKSHNIDNHRGEKVCGCAVPYTHAKTKPDTGATSRERAGMGIENGAKAECGLRPLRDSNVPPAKFAGEECWQVLQPSVQKQGAPTAGRSQPPATKDGRQQPSMEGWSDAPKEARQLCAGSVCSGARVGCADGARGRVCNGTPAGDGTNVRLPADSDGVCASCGSRPIEQRRVESGAMAGQQKSQTLGAWPVCGGCGLPVVPRGLGTALKPSLEPVTVARKPLIGTVAENVLAHGTGALNIDGCRVGDEVLPAVTAGQAKLGTFERGVMVTPERAGRWPANLIHSGDDEVTGLLGSAARFFYCAKASKRDRDEGLEGFEAVHRPNGNKWTDQDYRVARGERPPSAESGPRKNIHPTVKPTDLMAYLCRLVTPPGGTVLDPFMGSGSTGKAAMREGFRFVGIEREAQYMDIARARIYGAVPAACDLFSASNKPSREAA